MKKLGIVTILALLAAPVAALAADATVYADLLSAYVFEGLVGNDEPVFQPGLDVSGPYGVDFSFWGSINVTDVDSPWYPDSAGEWGELNLGVSWTIPWEGPVSLSVGSIYYVYPQDASEVLFDEDDEPYTTSSPADGGCEYFVEATAEGVVLTPTVRFSHTADGSDNWKVLASIGHSLPVADALSLDLGASVGFAGKGIVENSYLSDTGSAFTFAQVDASLNYELSPAVSIGLKGAFSTLLDSDIRDAIKASDYPKSDIFFGGVTASYSF